MPSTERVQVASLAHAKAHEVIALRSVLGDIRKASTLEEVVQAVNRRIDQAQHTLTLIAGEGAGHA